MKLLTLNSVGIIAALLLGAGVLYFGRESGIGYLLLLIIFLVAGTLVTFIGKEKKKKIGLYERERGWTSVISNGIVPLLASAFSSPQAYLGAVASITADKFSSEIGMLCDDPVFLANLQKVKSGTSGAVSGIGTLAGFLGALLISLSAYLLLPELNQHKLMGIVLAGLGGDLADSVAGIFENMGVGNKETSNIIGSLFGAFLGIILL